MLGFKGAMERKTQLRPCSSHWPSVLPQGKLCINDPLRNDGLFTTCKGFSRCKNVLR